VKVKNEGASVADKRLSSLHWKDLQRATWE
jgi:hypothetical protein